ncbi:MAG: hypothetical protein OEN20_10820 [Gammaproteobacteria bacterium]|nr:hypothetical protein [Gammaproteobacteria bacterium]
MSADFPIEYNPRHVETFLEKIARNRDRELQQIDQQVHAEVSKIRQQAHTEARQLARRVIRETRERERRQRDRYLYKLRSELTRERWGMLKQIHERVLRDVRARFARAWADQDRQSDWCRLWIESARSMAAANDLHIYCGAGTSDAVVEKMRHWLSDYPGRCEWHVDTARPPGLLVEWTDHHLDGSLDRQCEMVVEAVLNRVAEMLDIDDPDENGPR